MRALMNNVFILQTSSSFDTGGLLLKLHLKIHWQSN